MKDTELVIDRKMGYVTKRAERLEHEAHYLTHVPPPLAPLFPRVFSVDPRVPEITTEFYAYPLLSERVVRDSEHWDETAVADAWERIMDRLWWVHCQFLKAVSDKATGPAIFAELLWMLLDKTLFQFEALKTTVIGKFMTRRCVRVNGKACMGLRTRWDQIASALHKLKPMASTVIHGDLTFSNIMYDEREGLLRLANPRGCFGKLPGVMGDPRYDAAKLFQCAVGEFDLFAADKFRVEFSGGADVRLEVRAHPAWLPKAWAARFCGTYAPEDMTLMSALLYVDAALTAPASVRQLALYATALQLLEARFA